MNIIRCLIIKYNDVCLRLHKSLVYFLKVFMLTKYILLIFL